MKGSRRRPSNCSAREYARRHEATFGGAQTSAPEPVWSKVEDEGRDAFVVDMEHDIRFGVSHVYLHARDAEKARNIDLARQQQEVIPGPEDRE